MRPERFADLTRREALAAGLSAAGALAVGTWAGAAPSDESPYGPFKFGIQSYSLRGYPQLDKALAVTKELGLKYWESYPGHIPTVTDSAQAAKYRERTREAGVSVIGYGVAHFSKDHDANRKFFEFAKLMGIEYLSADPDPNSFDSLDKLVEEYGVAIGIHNHGPGSRYDKIEVIEKAIKDHHRLIGCCNDTGHFLRSREDPVRAVEVFGKRIYGVHLKDVKNASEFTVLGKGDLRVADLFKALAKNHYNYGMALEYEEHPENPVEDIKACLAAAREAAATLKSA